MIWGPSLHSREDSSRPNLWEMNCWVMPWWESHFIPNKGLLLSSMCVNTTALPAHQNYWKCWTWRFNRNWPWVSEVKLVYNRRACLSSHRGGALAWPCPPRTLSWRSKGLSQASFLSHPPALPVSTALQYQSHTEWAGPCPRSSDDNGNILSRASWLSLKDN